MVNVNQIRQPTGLAACYHPCHRFHSGSLAFGALIIALIQLARAILAYIQKKLKGKTGRIAKAILCMMQCCLWCFEKILKYINRQAYIEVSTCSSVYGSSYVCNFDTFILGQGRNNRCSMICGF